MEDIKVTLIKKLEVEYIIKCTFLLSYIILYNKNFIVMIYYILTVYNMIDILIYI